MAYLARGVAILGFPSTNGKGFNLIFRQVRQSVNPIYMITI